MAVTEKYYPETYAELQPWLANFNTKLNTYAATLDVEAATLAAVADAVAGFNERLGERDQARLASKAATVNLAGQARAVAGIVRPLVEQIQANPACNDDIRVEMGITVRKSRPSPAPEIEVAPFIEINAARALQHRLKVVRGGGNNPTRGKPPEASGVQVVAKVGPLPTAPEECQTVYFGGKASAEVNWTGADAGQQVTFFARYYNDRHTGPWSAAVTTTIVAATPTTVETQLRVAA